MDAVLLRKTGGPEVLEYQTVEDPRPGPGEVRIRVRATSVNRLDVFIRDGTYPVPLPHILGADVAGEIDAEGLDASSPWQAGDRVVAYPALTCGTCPWCRKGQEGLCAKVGILGRARFGGYADLVCLPSSSLVALPPSIPWDLAGGIPLAYLTAEHMLARAGVRGGETVLVLGASGGVGSALLDLLSRRGTRNIAVTRNAGSTAGLKAQGASDVIVSSGLDLAEMVAALTDGQGADVVLDLIGGALWDPARAATGRGGRHVIAGVASGVADVRLNLRNVYNPQQTVTGAFLGDRSDFIRVLEYLRAGRLRPKIHIAYPLKQADEAHREIDRPHLGKIVLRPRSS